MIDTDLYHLQIVRWNQEYGTVPGLANLYLRYGFYSNWLSLVSIFALPFKSENYLYLNVTLSIWFLLFIIQRLSFYLQRYADTRGNKIFSWTYTFLIILLFTEWGLFRVNASSTSYDFIVSCLTLILLLQVTEEIVAGSFSTVSGLLPLIIISASIPFFKLSGLPTLLVLPVYFLVTRKKKTVYLSFAGLLVLYCLPFLYRNYIQTGYPLFPYTFISPNNPDWQVPLQMTDRIARFISLLNKYFNQAIPGAEWNQPTFQWVKSWLTHLPFTDQLIVLLAAAGLPVFIIYSRKNPLNPRKINAVYFAVWPGLLTWFLLSPDPRFAYGYLLFVVSFPFSFLAAKWMHPKLIPVSLLLAGIFLTVYGFGKFNNKNLMAPEPVTKPESYAVTIHNAVYNIPVKTATNKGARCYYSSLPCIYETNPYLEQRGESLKDGFRMTRNIDSVFINTYSY